MASLAAERQVRFCLFIVGCVGFRTESNRTSNAKSKSTLLSLSCMFRSRGSNTQPNASDCFWKRQIKGLAIWTAQKSSPTRNGCQRYNTLENTLIHVTYVITHLDPIVVLGSVPFCLSCTGLRGMRTGCLDPLSRNIVEDEQRCL
jgi:hypothetical protein